MFWLSDFPHWIWQVLGHFLFTFFAKVIIFSFRTSVSDSANWSNFTSITRIFMSRFGIFNFLSHLLFEFFRFNNFRYFILNHRFQITGKLSFEKARAFAFSARLRIFFVNFCIIAFIALDHLIFWLFWNSWRFSWFHADSCRVHHFTVKNFIFFFFLLANHIWTFQSLNRSFCGESSNRWSEILWNTWKALIKHIGESLICCLVAMGQN